MIGRPLVIGVSGKMGSGKDAIATRLKECWGFTVTHFSDALKDEVIERLPRTLRVLHDTRCSCEEAVVDECIRHMVHVLKPAGVRELLQEYGTEVRRSDDPDYWCKRWQEGAARAQKSVVVADVRFPNEAKAVLDRGGLLWRVVRPGVSLSSHVSETLLDDWEDWDMVIQNNGTLLDLWSKVDWLVEDRR